MHFRTRVAVAVVVSGFMLCVPLTTTRAQEAASVDKAQLARCSAIEAASERLTCYDTLAGRSTDASALALSPQQAFGLDLARKDPSDKLETISAKVVRIGRAKFARLVVELDNGHVWELDTDDVRLEVGETVSIRRGALRSFLLSTPQRKAFRAKRLR